MENGGVPKFPHHLCKSDDHNFLVQTLIRGFLNSKEISLSLEFNKIKFSAKTWAKH